jgi:hypothetical protein
MAFDDDDISRVDEGVSDSDDGVEGASRLVSQIEDEADPLAADFLRPSQEVFSVLV